jgi:D-alanine-D-alanine ligase-like ATP-grasp enzyme
MRQAGGLAARAALRARSAVDVARLVGVRPTVAHLRAAREESVDRAVIGALFEELWGEAAAQQGATVRPLGHGLLEIRRGDAVTRLRHNAVMLEDIVSFALDKEIGLRLLTEAGLPVPEHLVLGNADGGHVDRFLAEGCVVKPAAGYSGRGVTCGVRTRRELRLAVRRASGYSTQILLERMVLGASYRVLLLDGELLDVILRHPPRVRGDGRSTIGELIAAENRRRVAGRGLAGLGRLELDLDLALTLVRAGRTLRSVPADGELVTVKTAVAGNGRDENERVGDALHPDVLADCVRAAEVLGTRLAGVDLITRDIARPLEQTGGAIIEVNTLPSLLHHVNVADQRDAPDIAGRILARLLENAERGPFVR